jgi:hypothetical protein
MVGDGKVNLNSTYETDLIVEDHNGLVCKVRQQLQLVYWDQSTT